MTREYYEGQDKVEAKTAVSVSATACCSTADIVMIPMDRSIAEFARDEMERGADHLFFGKAYDQLNKGLSR